MKIATSWVIPTTRARFCSARKLSKFISFNTEFTSSNTENHHFLNGIVLNVKLIGFHANFIVFNDF